MHVNRRDRLNDKGRTNERQETYKNFIFCKKENRRKVDTKANMKFYNEANKKEEQGNR